MVLRVPNQSESVEQQGLDLSQVNIIQHKTSHHKNDKNSPESCTDESQVIQQSSDEN